MLIFLQFSIGIIRTMAVVTSSRHRPFCFHNFVFLLNCVFVLYNAHIISVCVIAVSNKSHATFAEISGWAIPVAFHLPASILLSLPFLLPLPCPSPPWSEGPGCHFFILHWCKRVFPHFEISWIEFLSMFRRKKIMKIGHFLCFVTSSCYVIDH